MMSKKSLAFTCAALAAFAGTAALAFDAASVAQGRDDFFHSLGKPFKGLNEEMRKPAPDMAIARAYVATIAKTAPGITSQFPAGSGPQPGVKTAAKAEIWTNPGLFKQRQDAFLGAVKNLDAASKGNDIAAFNAALSATRDTCKACHADFKQKDH